MDAHGQPCEQQRSIFYCAALADSSLAEVFQETRRLNRTRNAPWLEIFVLRHDVDLLDLTGAFPTRVGASMVIISGSRARARESAKRFYAAHQALQGICYASSTHRNERAIALADRAEKSGCVPAHPELNRALADDSLLDVLKYSAHRLGYALL